MRYGKIHQLVDFIERSIPARSHTRASNPQRPNVLGILKRLDAAQEENTWLTLHFQTGGEMRAHYKGQLAFTLKPAKGHLRLIIGRQWGAAARAVTKAIKGASVNGKSFHVKSDNSTHRQWLLNSDDAISLCRIVEAFERDNEKLRAEGMNHPRGFSSEVRQAAFAAFQRGGSWCPGIPGRKRHKVLIESGDRIEYDHLIPYAKGGASSAINVQVLCSGCNNAKRARIL